MNRKLQSKLAPFIKGMLEERQSAGYSNNSGYIRLIFEFDTYVAFTKYDTGSITQELVEKWSVQKDTEDKNSRNKRIGIVRKLSEYMNSIGMDAYKPLSFGSNEYKKPYVPTRNELKLFFHTVDTYKTMYPTQTSSYNIFSVVFRMYYCLGMRRNEVIHLKRNDVSFLEGTIYIRHSKGDKDRILFLRKDILQLLKKYDDYVNQNIIVDREWFFMRLDYENHLSESYIGKLFKKFWLLTFPNWKYKMPTIHSLRHAFVVHRLNDYIAEGNKAEDLLPYLSRFLGHENIQNSMYYYHSLDSETDAFTRFIETDNSKSEEETLQWLE